MINRNATFIRKIKICLNVLLHYSKYKKSVGEQVEIFENEIKSIVTHEQMEQMAYKVKE